jgi:hypothetical protein
MKETAGSAPAAQVSVERGVDQQTLRSLRAAQRETGICEATLRRWIRSGLLTAHGGGRDGATLVALSQVLALRERRDYASMTETCQILKADYHVVRKLCEAGELPHVRNGRRWWVERAPLEALARERAEWITLREAERRTPLDLRALRRLRDEGRLDVRSGYTRGHQVEQLVHIDQLAQVVAELLDRPAACPGCGRPTLPGRLWHNECKQQARAEATRRAFRDPVVREQLLASRRGPRGRSEAISEGKRRFYATPAGEKRRRAVSELNRDPKHRLFLEVARWGQRGNGYLRRATERYEAAVARRRGGAPPKTELHERWRAMRDGQDPELEELLAADGMKRTPAIAWLDWQRYPVDWPREKWPASRSDPDDMDGTFMRAAADRVWQALRKMPANPAEKT